MADTPFIKTIKFNDFRKHFHEALLPTVSNKVIFYKINENDIEISFSFDNFIIITKEKFISMMQEFPPESVANDMDVRFDEENPDLNPSVKKFVIHYMHGRGIKVK